MGDIRLALDGAFELAGTPTHGAPARSALALWQRPASVAAMVLVAWR
jgi:hypothetical protein